MPAVFSAGNRGKSSVYGEYLIMEEPPIPRREAKVRIAQAGYEPPSDDQIDRWHSEGLLCEQPSTGRPLAHGYSETQVRRLIAIARIVAALKSQRVRSSEIAFGLCVNGAIDIPPGLVCEHVEVAVRAFQAKIRRILNEIGSRNEGFYVGFLGKARKLGGLLAKNILLKAIPSLARSGFAREVIGTTIGLFLRALAKPVQYGELAGDIRRTTTALRPDSMPPTRQALRELFATISDASQLLRLDEENAMLLAIRTVGDSGEIFSVVEFTRNLLAVASRFFPWMTNPNAVPWLDAEDREFLRRYSIPVVCGAMATIRANEYTKGLAADLRAGNTGRASVEFAQMKQFGDYFVGAISVKEVE